MLVSIKAREKEYEEFLSDLDNQVWKNVRRMAKILDGKRRKLCHVIQRCAHQCVEIIAAKLLGNAMENSRVSAAQPAGSGD